MLNLHQPDEHEEYMAATKQRPTIELLKILLDGNWQWGGYLVLAAGKYIPPEKASRKKVRGKFVSVEAGRAIIMRDTLSTLYRSGKLEKRKYTTTTTTTNDWKLKDVEWANRMIRDDEKRNKRIAAASAVEVEPASVEKRSRGRKGNLRFPSGDIQKLAKDSLLTVDEVAERLAISKSTLRRMISRGEIPVVTIAQRNLRIKLTDIEGYIAEHYNRRKGIL